MLVEQRRGPFRTATIILEDPLAVSLSSYSKVTVISHNRLPLSEWKCTQKQTGLIDLTADFFSSFRATTKNEIRRTLKDPSFHCSIGAVGQDDFHMYENFERSIGRRPFKRNVFAQCIAVLVSFQGTLISGVYIYPSLPISRVRSIFSLKNSADRDIEKRVSFASRRAMYEACLWVQKQSGTGLDLASINTSTEEKARKADYKLSFNPRLITEYHYEYTSPLYGLCERVALLLRYASSR